MVSTAFLRKGPVRDTLQITRRTATTSDNHAGKVTAAFAGHFEMQSGSSAATSAVVSWFMRSMGPPVPIDFVDVSVVTCGNESHRDQSYISALGTITSWTGEAPIVPYELTVFVRRPFYHLAALGTEVPVGEPQNRHRFSWALQLAWPKPICKRANLNLLEIVAFRPTTSATNEE